MKKNLVIAGLALAGVVSLASCSTNKGGDDLPDTSSRETATYINYIQDKITFSSTAMNASSIDENKAHYEVFLPETIDTAYRLTVADASKFSKKSKAIYANYAVLENSWGDDEIDDVINILAEDTTLGVFPKVSNKVEADESYFDTEASTRRLATLYIPVQVNYVGNKDVDDDVYSYVFAPVYSVLTTLTNDVLADSKAQSYNNNSYLITFNSKVDTTK